MPLLFFCLIAGKNDQFFLLKSPAQIVIILSAVTCFLNASTTSFEVRFLIFSSRVLQNSMDRLAARFSARIDANLESVVLSIFICARKAFWPSANSVASIPASTNFLISSKTAISTFFIFEGLQHSVMQGEILVKKYLIFLLYKRYQQLSILITRLINALFLGQTQCLIQLSQVLLII